jgi:hypothetical protein
LGKNEKPNRRPPKHQLQKVIYLFSHGIEIFKPKFLITSEVLDYFDDFLVQKICMNHHRSAVPKLDLKQLSEPRSIQNPCKVM